MRHYEKNGERWRGGRIYLDGRVVFNPTEEQLAAAGYVAVEVAPHERTLEEAKAQKIAEIDAYDNSDAVNSFTLDGVRMWLEFERREKIRSRLPVEKGAGRDTTTLWYGTTPVRLPITLAEALLDRIELYAADCYDVTASHKAAVEGLDTVEGVDAYGYTTGYPEMLDINTEG